jgi:hypothetical protein
VFGLCPVKVFAPCLCPVCDAAQQERRPLATRSVPRG